MTEPQHVPYNVEVGMTDQPDLVTWLRAQLDDDERVARKADHDDPAPWDRKVDLIDVAKHIGRWDPARVLAEVDAKRRILDRWQELRDEVAHWQSVGDEDAMPTASEWAYGQVVRTLALPFADRPGYREQWRP